MREASPSNNISTAEDRNICIENNEEICITAQNYPEEKNHDVKDCEIDFELLELEESEAGDNLLQVHSKPFDSTVSSPRLVTKNRRYTLRPKKSPETTQCDEYTSTNNRKKITPSKNGSLETIFENPVLRNESLAVWGKTKMKRYLSFDSFVSKTKLKHRKLRLKRLGKGMKKKGSCKITVEDVKLKLKDLEEDEDMWMDVQE